MDKILAILLHVCLTCMQRLAPELLVCMVPMKRWYLTL